VVLGLRMMMRFDEEAPTLLFTANGGRAKAQY
jgi:hypothetical protein